MPTLQVYADLLTKQITKQEAELEELKKQLVTKQDEKLRQELRRLRHQYNRLNSYLETTKRLLYYSFIPPDSKQLSATQRKRDKNYKLIVGTTLGNRKVIITRPHRRAMVSGTLGIFDLVIPGAIFIFNEDPGAETEYGNGSYKKEYGWCNATTPDVIIINNLFKDNKKELKLNSVYRIPVVNSPFRGASMICKIQFDDIPIEDRKTEEAHSLAIDRFFNSIVTNDRPFDLYEWNILSKYIPANHKGVKRLERTGIFKNIEVTPRTQYVTKWTATEIETLLNHNREKIAKFWRGTKEKARPPRLSKKS